MAIHRVHRKIERTPEQIAEMRAERGTFQRERPGLDDLIESGDYGPPQRHGDVMALLTALATLKQQRERRGLTLDQVSERSGLDKGMLSRLENGKILNPTIATLQRYAEAIGATVSLVVREAPAEV